LSKDKKKIVKLKEIKSNNDT